MLSPDYRQGLESLASAGEPAIVAASFDLRPGVSGFETATAILREGIRATQVAAELSEHQIKSAEEERERFAREAAAQVSTSLDGASAILMHGTSEFEARLVSELAPRVRHQIVRERGLEHSPSADELAQEARARAVDIQFEAAEELYRRVHDGAAGDRGLSGAAALLTAAREGRLGSLVVDEDALGDMGDAIDARLHAATQDPDLIRDLLATARDRSVECWFARVRPEAYPSRCRPVQRLCNAGRPMLTTPIRAAR